METALNKSLSIFVITITLVACGDGGGGSDDGIYHEYSAFTRPPPPREITIKNDADGNIVLDWKAAERAESYNIFWSTSGHSDLENTINSVKVTETSFVHKNLSLGTTYYYTITAVDDGWESHQSSTQLSTTAGVPTKPVNLSADSISSDIELSWDASARADAYDISWSNSLGQSGMINFATSPFLHIGLVGVGYEYVVTASNAYGNSLEVAVAAYPELPPETPVGPSVRVTTAFDFCFADLEDCTGFVREDKTLVQVDWRDIGADYQDIGGEYEVFGVYPSGQAFRVATTSNSYYSKTFRRTSSPADSFCYYVVARNNFGMSLPTDTRCGGYF